MSRNALRHARRSRLWFGPALLLMLALSSPRPAAAQGPARSPDGPAAAARVVVVHDPGATTSLIPVPEIVTSMVESGLTNLTGKATVIEACRSLVSTQDVVGLKVFSTPGPNSGTRPAVVAAVVQALLKAGLPPAHIVIWDHQAVDLRLAGFEDLGRRYGVRVLDSLGAGYDLKTFYETPLLGNLRYDDVDFGKTGPGVGRKSYVSKLLTADITKIINITPLMHHNLAGVSGNLFTLAIGSVDNTLRFEGDSANLARAIPEIYALPILGDRVVLNIVDALFCQYEGQDRGLLHYSAVLNELRFSRDPVALDVLSLQEIDRQRELAGVATNRTDSSWTLLSNASLLEIGVSDPRHIQVERLPVSPGL